jgi:hypothetical protein
MWTLSAEEVWRVGEQLSVLAPTEFEIRLLANHLHAARKT